MKETAITKAIKQGLALVVYQDSKGVHIGVIDNISIMNARGATDGDEPFWQQGWIDTEGGSVEKLADVAAFGPPWESICDMLVDED